ncbi:MAG TPA: chemotaxis protein CheD [Vicinamibacterales bacterium]|nr:chemotaxis protein CheD [Vicinamibacterales bacterium]
MSSRTSEASTAPGPDAAWAPLPRVGNLESVYLHAGHLLVSRTPCRVTTVLGSCVSVGIWDPAAGIGGLNHFLLPHGAAQGARVTRYGTAAMRALIDAVLAAGGRRNGLQAKLFGGACVLRSFQKSGWHLGTQNVAVARAVLLDEGIPLVAEDVEGERGRKLIFQTHDGSAWVRTL